MITDEQRREKGINMQCARLIGSTRIQSIIASVLEKVMAPPSSTLAWKIPWTQEPGVLQSMRSRRVGHDWATSLSLFTFMHWRRKWKPTPVFLPGESQGRGAWWAAVYGVAQSQTRLKRFSSSSGSRPLVKHIPLLVLIFSHMRSKTYKATDKK